MAATKRWQRANPERHREHSRSHYHRHAETALPALKARRRADPLRIMLNQARHRAKVKGLDFALDGEALAIPQLCPVLGIPIFQGQGETIPNSPSLDRIDSAKGYTPDNVLVISHRANKLKRDATPDELRQIAEFYTRDPRPAPGRRDKPVAGAMMSRAKVRAQVKGLDYALTHADITVPETCPVLGMRLELGARGDCANAPSLDRIDNARGYTPGNVLVVSNRVNTLKGDASVDELRRLADFYGGQHYGKPPTLH